MGIVLYFKMLKYFSCLFLFFFLLSIPSMIIYAFGDTVSEHKVDYHKWINLVSLGHMDGYSDHLPASVTVNPTYNLAT